MTPRARRSTGPPAGHSRALVKRQRSATHGLLRLLRRAGRIIDIITRSRRMRPARVVLPAAANFAISPGAGGEARLAA